MKRNCLHFSFVFFAWFANNRSGKVFCLGRSYCSSKLIMNFVGISLIIGLLALAKLTLHTCAWWHGGLSNIPTVDNTVSSNIRKKVDKMIEWGVPESKIVLGINFRGIAGGKIHFANGNAPSPRSGRDMGYYEFCSTLHNTTENPSFWIKSYDADSELTLLTSKAIKKNIALIVWYESSRHIHMGYYICWNRFYIWYKHYFEKF